jgi:hypothetical protein
VQIDFVALLRSRWHSGALPALPSGRGASSLLIKHLPTFTVHDFICLIRKDQEGKEDFFLGVQEAVGSNPAVQTFKINNLRTPKRRPF